MDVEILKTAGQAAGIGGLSIGLAILVFRDVIRKNIFPSLTKAQSFRIILIVVVCTWSIALAGIGAWVYTETYAPEKKEDIEISNIQPFLIEYGFSALSAVDVNIKNKGNFPDNIAKVKVNIKDIFKYNYDPCPTCFRLFAKGVYSISFKKVAEGLDEYLLPHTIEPNSIERIILVFGGDFSDRESYLARITLTLYTGGGKKIETKPVTILVQNFDKGEIAPIAELTQKELKELVDSENTTPQIITPNLIKTYFSEDGNRGAFGTRLPSLPDWYKG